MRTCKGCQLVSGTALFYVKLTARATGLLGLRLILLRKLRRSSPEKSHQQAAKSHQLARPDHLGLSLCCSSLEKRDYTIRALWPTDPSRESAHAGCCLCTRTRCCGIRGLCTQQIFLFPDVRVASMLYISLHHAGSEPCKGLQRQEQELH